MRCVKEKKNRLGTIFERKKITHVLVFDSDLFGHKKTMRGDFANEPGTAKAAAAQELYSLVLVHAWQHIAKRKNRNQQTCNL